MNATLNADFTLISFMTKNLNISDQTYEIFSKTAGLYFTCEQNSLKRNFNNMSIDWEIYVSRYQQYLHACNSFLQFYLASLKTIVRSSIVHVHIFMFCWNFYQTQQGKYIKSVIICHVLKKWFFFVDAFKAFFDIWTLCR